MTRSGWAIAMSLLASGSLACGGDGGGADGGPGGDGGGPDSGLPSTVDPSNAFATEAQELSVPKSGLDEGFAQPSSSADYRYWTTMDIDGDRWPDIVQTGATDLAQSAWDADGSPYWKVFRGGGERWSAAAVEWRLSPSGTASGFYQPWVSGNGEWRTFDITGDQKPDLVHTGDPQTGGVWDREGDPHWKVYVNDGEGGFSKRAIEWPVPDSGTELGFVTSTYESATWHWATEEMDGDELPDLVQTADPATGKVWDDGGEPHWKVFRNNGDGFDRDPIIWPVPDSGTDGGFYSMQSTGTGRWRVMDIDDDERADLLQTSDPATGKVWDAGGEAHWKVFAGSDTGFAATPAKWPVPSSGLEDGFFDASSSSANRLWAMADIDGDGDPDLVQTGDVSHESRVWDASADPYWKVWRNQGGGFAAEVHRWRIPKSGTENGFYAVAASDGYTTWTMLDADNDRHQDLVQTEDPATGRVWDATGSPYWKVFRGVE